MKPLLCLLLAATTGCSTAIPIPPAPKVEKASFGIHCEKDWDFPPYKCRNIDIEEARNDVDAYYEWERSIVLDNRKLCSDLVKEALTPGEFKCGE